MSNTYPIVAVTGSSGAGTTTVRHAFADIFRREGIKAAFVEGDSFRRYDRKDMKQAVQVSIQHGRPISHFGPEANLFDRLESLFRTYSENGAGEMRHYVQGDEVDLYGQEPGTFTPWRAVPRDADLLFYEGLHGAVALEGEGIDVSRWVDLLIGVVPIVNLEWIQKIHRDAKEKGKSPESVTASILRRLEDYVKHIAPQFSRTHINFQRVPTVDTSDPFIARDIPTLDESVVVVRFRDPRHHNFPDYLRRIHDSYMSRPNTMVVPGGKMGVALEVVCTPIIHRMLEAKRASY